MRSGTNSGGVLLLTFNSSATAALVDSTLQQITYSNTAITPPGSVTVDFVIDDGNTGAQGSGGALQGSGSVTVTIIPVNDPPLTGTDQISLDEGASADTLVGGAVSLLTNDFDPDLGMGEMLTVSTVPVSQPQQGSVNLFADGTFLYTHSSDLNQSDMTPGPVDYYAFYTNNDELVWYWGTGPLGIPLIRFDNAELGAGATNIEIGQMCPLRIVGHLGMILDPVPIHMTIDALSGNPVSVPLATCLLPPVPV